LGRRLPHLQAASTALATTGTTMRPDLTESY
jgi:hypothetical protein